MISKSTSQLLLLLTLLTQSVLAQSPKDLLTNVDLTSCTDCTTGAPDGFFSSETQVINAFNFARRREEADFSMAANALGNLTLPVGYSSMTHAQKMFYLINVERVARAGKNYGGVIPIGLPLDNVESNLSTLAQNHANDMVTNNFFAHDSPTTGLSPYQRIDNSATYGAMGACREFITYSENLYVSCDGSTATPTYVVEQAVFALMYRDAGSAWGHRRAILIQNNDSYSGVGFNNNVGSALSEGYLGVGVANRTYNGTEYPSCGTNNLHAHVVVTKIADPKPTCTYNVVLPIELLSFTGKKLNNSVQLNWATANEKDNAYFYIERSSDGRNFNSIGQIKGNGTTSYQTNYAYEDLTPLSTINYYRLVQVDMDGKQSVSAVIAINMGRSKDVVVYPNPVRDILSVQIPESATFTKIELMNTQGQVVLSSAQSGQLQVDVLPAGIYYLRTQLDGQLVVKKVMKL
jgi:uncharacterized protein YkwD